MGDDLLVKEEPTVGSVLVFLVYSDPSGLGAERALSGSHAGAKDRVASTSQGLPRPVQSAPSVPGAGAAAQVPPATSVTPESTRNSTPTASSAPQTPSTPEISHPNPEIAKFLAAWMNSIGSTGE